MIVHRKEAAVYNACTYSNSSRSRKGPPKTPAERARTYRARKKLLKEMEQKQNSRVTSLVTSGKTSTERGRKFRMRKRSANEAGISPMSVSGENNSNVLERSSTSMRTTDVPISPGDNNENKLVEIVKTATELSGGYQESRVGKSLRIVGNDHLESMNDLCVTNSSGEKFKGTKTRKNLRDLHDRPEDELLKVFPTEQADTKMLNGKNGESVCEAPDETLKDASRESSNPEFESYHSLAISPIHIKEERVEKNRGSMIAITSFHQDHQEPEEERCVVNYTRVPPIPRQLEEEDEDILFFRSLLPHVRRIPDTRKLTFRNRVQELVECFAYD